ncbi:MAG TPA: FtsK/SpoIIIE domain-containing protein [Ktedonobacteraceae bacterium]|nr:FtsK/SpoIIIE domain-containing protein [Ktedonobacteraceae bacterium]
MTIYRSPSRTLGSTSAHRALGQQEKTQTVAQVLVERIIATYSREQAAKDGIYFWPEPLPTPVATLLPDPLVLFRPPAANMPVLTLDATRSVVEEQQERISVLQMTQHDAVTLRNQDCFLNMVLSRGRDKSPDGPMRFPLGLADIPDEQKRDIFCVDLHGSAGALTGGPLLIAGAQNSGKATALQTMLLWLITRYTPQQLRCVIIDPNHDLDFMQDLPYVRDTDGTLLWTDGNTDELLTQMAERITQMLARRRDAFPNQRWDDATLSQLRAQGVVIPSLLLIISHYHSFAERFKAMETLKKLVLTVNEARATGAYIVLTSAEVSSRYFPPDLMGKMGTKIGLFLNEQQRYDLLGRTPSALEPIPGRGFALTRDRSLREVQIALPVAGALESTRYEAYKKELERLSAIK